jgi:hypothetical protein
LLEQDAVLVVLPTITILLAKIRLNLILAHVTPVYIQVP